MTEKNDRPRHRQKRDAVKRLLNDLADVGAGTSSALVKDDEMFSFMVDEAFKGVDISLRYPTFYKKLLNDADLRQNFLDALELIEGEDQGELAALPKVSRPNLAFVTGLSSLPMISILGKNKWRAKWLRKVKQLQAVFFPREFAYRSDTGVFEEPWFALLRWDMEVDGVLYSISLECKASEEREGALSVFLELTATPGPASDRLLFPIQAALRWGVYDSAIRITEPGQARFPDVPFASIFDSKHQNVKSDLHLTLETVI